MFPQLVTALASCVLCGQHRGTRGRRSPGWPRALGWSDRKNIRRRRRVFSSSVDPGEVHAPRAASVFTANYTEYTSAPRGAVDRSSAAHKLSGRMSMESGSRRRLCCAGFVRRACRGRNLARGSILARGSGMTERFGEKRNSGVVTRRLPRAKNNESTAPQPTVSLNAPQRPMRQPLRSMISLRAGANEWARDTLVATSMDSVGRLVNPHDPDGFVQYQGRERSRPSSMFSRGGLAVAAGPAPKATVKLHIREYNEKRF